MADEGRLTTVTRTQGANAALKSGEVVPRGVEFAFTEIPVLVQGFRRMVRTLEFDVSEMALTTYLVAREHGVRFTALPVFLVRGFHHGAIYVRPGSGVREPKDLEGRRVGVSRGYTVTTGVWARVILREQYGVDLDRITWVLSGDEHVERYRPPRNVVPLGSDRTLVDALAADELAAVIGVDADTAAAAGFAPLIPNPEQAGYDALLADGLYPVNHLIVVRDELLAKRPELASEVFEAFARAKDLYVQKLRTDAIAQPTANDRMLRRVMELTVADPLPYGLEPNRAILERLIGHAVDQRILTRPRPLDELFAPVATTV
jgi:ABC-type nitrate/sulfonate/bicarbonate transport system substrate-binding protein